MKCPGCKKDIEVEQDRLAYHRYVFHELFEFGKASNLTYRECPWSGQQLVSTRAKTDPKEQMEMDFS